ncbi:hypothetical protein [Alicyclobacillus acidocaldarius]|uniref:Uncharacterized protein n=1 Tax=Alicyclobacillus acidocaldarius subsp. acidocaldarius (strain ATCC 27009 / DSM 446 / BCRC 14685 / JCM 5260 / KCTC 1825 / NBRC 15652 / NCIMB 11725 / NRRL B-14509 / 104-IA) TaxID=521098 RepID=C8WS97_ALIAD|nr:hypothetical protein [Alicyclobacillus acidocaldarius]ACV57531.1 hypothetical protein Aaci_0473 [Alicyclobacillus acidocaldarius subsp. acidocaldarius DSM 446]
MSTRPDWTQSLAADMRTLMSAMERYNAKYNDPAVDQAIRTLGWNVKQLMEVEWHAV